MSIQERTTLTMRYLRADIDSIKKILEEADEQTNLEIRRQLRPLAVELLYEVIGTPKTFEEVLNDMEDK